MRPTAASLFACCCLLLAPALRADEVRLKDGRVLVGTVVERGDVLEVTTRDGVVRVPKTEVLEGELGWRKADKLRAALRDLESSVPDSPFSHLQLAASARQWGLDAEMWRHLDDAVQLPRDSKNANLRGRIDDFLAQLEPEVLPRRLRAADTRGRVHELLGRLQRSTGKGMSAAVLELLVREPNADQELRQEARRNSDPVRRVCAVEALLRRATPGNDRFALRTTIFDGNADVRARAAALSAEHTDPSAAVAYMAPGLMHANATVRERTAEAFANLGSPDAVKLLVLAGPNAGKALASADTGVRAHAAFIEQQAYIRDFDVEVAQASFIADPKIDTLQSGTVLDVTVAGVVEERHIITVYRGALKRLAGSDPGPQVRDWAAWYAGLQPQQAATPTPAPTTPGNTPTPGAASAPGKRDNRR